MKLLLLLLLLTSFLSVSGVTRVSRVVHYDPEYIVFPAVSGNSWLLNLKTWRTWNGAREECKKIGGDLATHVSEEDMKRIFFGKDEKGREPYWIVRKFTPFVGGRMNEQATEANFKDSFEWVDGTPIPANNSLWEYHVPYHFIKKCMIINPNDVRDITLREYIKGVAYSTEFCDNRGSYLCEIPKKRH